MSNFDKHIVIINGSGGKGKDKFVEYCSKYTSTMNISSVDKVKQAAIIFDWDGTKTEEDRKFLSDLKYLSSKYNDQPYKYIKKNIDYFEKYDTPANLMFIHIREPLEINRVKNDFNCKTLLIRNNNIESIYSNEADAHVEEYNYDYIIDNSGDLDDLKIKAKEFVYELLYGG